MTTQNNDPQQDLITGAAFGSIEQMLAALARGAQLDAAIPFFNNERDAVPFSGHHALSAAVFYGKPQVLTWLLERGARIDAPFGHAERGPFPPLDKSFDAAPAGPGSLMHMAAGSWLTTGSNLKEVSRVTLQLMQLLRAAGVDATSRNIDGATPLHMAAAERKSAPVAAFLLEAGCPIDAVDRAGWTALDRAVDESFAAMLLARGANPDGKAPPCDPYDRYARSDSISWHGNWLQLTNIIYRRAHGIAHERLRHGARATPHALYFAAQHAQSDLLEALLRAGADPNDRGPQDSDDSALAAAARTGDLRCVEVLLSAGALVDEFSLQPSEAEVGGRAVMALLAPRVDRQARSRAFVRLSGRARSGQLEVLIACGVDADLLPRGAAHSSPAATPSAPSLAVGRRASHPKFGSGIVVHLESGNSDARKVRIRFEDGVDRTLLVRFVQPA